MQLISGIGEIIITIDGHVVATSSQINCAFWATWRCRIQRFEGGCMEGIWMPENMQLGHFWIQWMESRWSYVSPASAGSTICWSVKWHVFLNILILRSETISVWTWSFNQSLVEILSCLDRSGEEIAGKGIRVDGVTAIIKRPPCSPDMISVEHVCVRSTPWKPKSLNNATSDVRFHTLPPTKFKFQ